MNKLKRLYFRLLMIRKYAFHKGKWRYQFAWLKNIIKGRIIYRMLGIGQPPFRSIDFAVTYKCNYACPHCYARTLIKDGEPIMQPEDYARVTKEAMKMGVRGLSLQGGEIFMRKDYKEIIKALQPHLNHITVTTNGSMLTEEIIKGLAELENDTVFFSVDSGIPEEHDRIRQHPGSFDYLMKMMKLVEKYGMKVAINTIVSKENLYSEGFKKILDFSHKNRIMLEAIFARPLGGWQGEEARVMLSKKDIEYFNELNKDYPFMVRDLSNNFGGKGCPCAKEVLYVTESGYVCGCPYLHVSFGNVMKEPLSKARERILNSKRFNFYNPVCLTAEDRDFIPLYLRQVKEKKIIPIEEWEEK